MLAASRARRAVSPRSQGRAHMLGRLDVLVDLVFLPRAATARNACQPATLANQSRRPRAYRSSVRRRCSPPAPAARRLHGDQRARKCERAGQVPTEFKQIGSPGMCQGVGVGSTYRQHPRARNDCSGGARSLRPRDRSVPYVPQRCWIKRSRVLVPPMRSGERSGHQWIARYSRAEGRLIAGARLPADSSRSHRCRFVRD
jgi:hypothetical protein